VTRPHVTDCDRATLANGDNDVHTWWRGTRPVGSSPTTLVCRFWCVETPSCDHSSPTSTDCIQHTPDTSTYLYSAWYLVTFLLCPELIPVGLSAVSQHVTLASEVTTTWSYRNVITIIIIIIIINATAGCQVPTLSVKPTVTLPVTGHHCPLASAKLHCLRQRHTCACVRACVCVNSLVSDRQFNPKNSQLWAQRSKHRHAPSRWQTAPTERNSSQAAQGSIAMNITQAFL